MLSDDQPDNTKPAFEKQEVIRLNVTKEGGSKH
jgi:hypothetical protein